MFKKFFKKTKEFIKANPMLLVLPLLYFFPEYFGELGFLFVLTNSHSIDLELSSSQALTITDGDQTGLDLTGDLTFEMWVKFESLVATTVLLSKQDPNIPQISYVLKQYVAGNELILQMYSGSSNEQWKINWTPSTGTWYHVAVSYDASAATCKFYIDGVQTGGDQVGTNTTIFNSNVPFAIGADYNTVLSNFFDGLIDDVRVWNDVRTGTEISDNYEKELNGDEAGLVAYWKLNNSLLDETSNDNDLTNNNSATFSTDVPFVGPIPVKIEKSLKYTILTTPSAITKSLEYAVFSGQAIQKSLKYTVTSTSAKTKSLKYTIIVTPSALTKSLEYQVLSDTAVTKSLKYTVKQTPSAITKSLEYQIITDTNINKSLHYEVTSQTALQKSLQYVTVKWYQPAKLTTAVGSITSGKLSDIYEAGNGILTLAEVQSANPAFVYEFDFYGVENGGEEHYDAHFIAKYTGLNASHKVKLQQYNFNTTLWENVTVDVSDFLYNAVMQLYDFHLLTSTDYFDSGNLKLRVIHVAGTGNDTDTFEIDQFILEYHGELTRTLKYTIKAPVKIEKSLKYVIETTPSAITKGLDYFVIVETPITKSLQYTIESDIAITKSLNYEVITDTAITKSLEYYVITDTNINKGLIYTVESDIAIQKSLQYALTKMPVNITKSLKYSVITIPTQKTKTLRYEIISQTAITKSLKYTVTSDLSITKELKYLVMAPVKITKSLIYDIVQPEVITKSLHYEIIVEKSITKSLIYVVRAFPYAYGDIPAYQPFY